MVEGYKHKMVLIAGPYRSGTDDRPELIARNMAAMNEAALAVFQAGHLPVAGEWFALPLLEAAGSGSVGDAIWDGIFHPVAALVAERCDACPRIGDASTGADAMVAIFERAGRPVFHDLRDLSTIEGALGHG